MNELTQTPDPWALDVPYWVRVVALFVAHYWSQDGLLGCYPATMAGLPLGPIANRLYMSEPMVEAALGYLTALGYLSWDPEHRQLVFYGEGTP